MRSYGEPINHAIIMVLKLIYTFETQRLYIYLNTFGFFFSSTESLG